MYPTSTIAASSDRLSATILNFTFYAKSPVTPTHGEIMADQSALWETSMAKRSQQTKVVSSSQP
jgi:hypothetical protein